MNPLTAVRASAGMIKDVFLATILAQCAPAMIKRSAKREQSKSKDKRRRARKAGNQSRRRNRK